jgi:hypothetical protein
MATGQTGPFSLGVRVSRVVSSSIVSSVVSLHPPLPSPCALGQQVIALLSVSPLLSRRLYYLCPLLLSRPPIVRDS